MKQGFLILIAISLLISYVACSKSTPPPPPPVQPTENSEMVEGTGTVVYNEFEGGFYGIKADDGSKYQVTNWQEEYKQEGLRVKFIGKRRTDLASYRMWGSIIELSNIEKIEK